MWAEVPFVLSQFTLLPYGHTDGWHLAHGYTAAAYLQHCKKSSKSCVFVLHCQILQFSGLNFHALQFEFHIPSFRPWFSRSVFSRLAIWSFIHNVLHFQRSGRKLFFIWTSAARWRNKCRLRCSCAWLMQTSPRSVMHSPSSNYSSVFFSKSTVFSVRQWTGHKIQSLENPVSCMRWLSSSCH